MSKKENIKKITNYLVENYKDYILFISLIENEENNSIFEDDCIDFLIITNEINYKLNQEIIQAINKNINFYNVGIFFTSRTETTNCNCLNYLAMQELYLVQKDFTKSLYQNPNFTYFIEENILKNVLLTICLADISKIINKVFNFDNILDKKSEQNELIKIVYYALKKYFISKNIIPTDIKQCFKILEEIASIKLDLDIEKILNKELTSIDDLEKLKKYCFNVAEYLLNQLNERNYIQSASQDIRVKTNDVTYKVRAGGLIEYQDKFLFVKMGLGSYWCVPGGHLEWFENSEDAVIREVEEETKMPVEVKNLFLLHENFYFNVKNQKFHEMCFYYLLKPRNEQNIIENQIREEFDKEKKDVLEFKWFTKEEIKNLDIKPTIIKEMILNNKIYTMNHEIKRNIND